MHEVQGKYDSKFEQVAQKFAEQLNSELEVGASYAVTIDGELVVDIWGGDADTNGTPWQQDTIVNVYSTTKTMCALVFHMLSDRGLLDFNAPISQYWPEFAAEGKGDMPVSYIMCHATGLAGWTTPISGEDLYDHNKMAQMLAAQKPMWKPGTASGYHAISQGYLYSEIVRRITGKTIGEYYRDEVAKPMGIDFHIGTPASADARVADLIPFPPEDAPFQFEAGSVGAQVWTNPMINIRATKTREWRGAEIPAANGHGNARSVAMAQTALVNGGSAFGVELMSNTASLRPLEKQISGDDLALGIPMNFGLGYGLQGELPLSPDARTVFWGGYGGSSIVLNYERRIVVAYAMNKMSPLPLGDPRSIALHYEVWAATS